MTFRVYLYVRPACSSGANRRSMAAALLTGVLSVSLTVPSAQLTSRPLAHAASCHTLRSVHHGIRMEEDGEDEASFERVYQQNVESGATTTSGSQEMRCRSGARPGSIL